MLLTAGAFDVGGGLTVFGLQDREEAAQGLGGGRGAVVLGGELGE